MGETIRENAMDFVDAMFGTPRQPGASRSRSGGGAAKTGPGEDVNRGSESGYCKATTEDHAYDVAHGTDDAAARTSESRSTVTANDANDAQTRTPEAQPATTGFTTEPGRAAGKGGGPAGNPPTQCPPALPPRDG